MKKNENFSDAELRRLAAASSDTGIHVPEGLEKDLSDMIDSMDAAERIIAGKSSPARRAMTLIMSAAAGIIVLLADILVKSLDFLAGIPTGIVVSVISVPYFLYLLVRK